MTARLVPDPVAEPTITVERAAQLLGISRGGAYAAVRRGEVPHLRVGKRIVVPTAALRRLLGLDPAPEQRYATEQSAGHVDRLRGAAS